MKEPKTYSPDEAAEQLLGWKGKLRGVKLRRAIQKKESKLGIHIAERKQYSTGKQALRITENNLRLYLPELFETSLVGVAREIKMRIDRIEASIPEQVASHVDERMRTGQRMANSAMAETHRIETGLMSEVEKLSRRISKLEAKSKIQ